MGNGNHFTAVFYQTGDWYFYDAIGRKIVKYNQPPNNPIGYRPSMALYMKM
jgi:hypothetical protein